MGSFLLFKTPHARRLVTLEQTGATNHLGAVHASSRSRAGCFSGLPRWCLDSRGLRSWVWDRLQESGRRPQAAPGLSEHPAPVLVRSRGPSAALSGSSTQVPDGFSGDRWWMVGAPLAHARPRASGAFFPSSGNPYDIVG